VARRADKSDRLASFFLFKVQRLFFHTFSAERIVFPIDKAPDETDGAQVDDHREVERVEPAVPAALVEDRAHE